MRRLPICIFALLTIVLAAPTPGRAFPLYLDGPFGYATDVGVYDVALSDLDLDGDLDAVVSSQNAAHSVSVWLNDGTGSFSELAAYPSGWSLYTLVRDLDADGLPDLAIADFQGNALITRRNLGGGAFGPPVNHPFGYGGPRCVTALDWDHDGDLELAVADFTSSDVRILSRVGPGLNYVQLRSINVGTNPKWITAADLNGDGWAEAIVANYTSGSITVLNSAGVPERTDYASGGGCSMVVVSDLDGNAVPDVATINESSGVRVHLGIGGGVLGAPTSYPIAAVLPQGIVAADFDGDGDNELVATSYNTSTVFALTNQGAGVFGEVQQSACGSRPRGINAGDLDGDGDPDLVVGNFQSSPGFTGFSILRNSVSEGPVIHSFDPTGNAGASMAIRGMRFTGTTAVHFGDVPAAFAVVSDLEISATVPADIRNCVLTVVHPRGNVTTSQLFYMPPVILGFSPDQGPVGSSVVIRGFNLLGTDFVMFNGEPAIFQFVSDSVVVATVPSTATTGRIQLTAPAGLATSDDVFTVGAATAVTLPTLVHTLSLSRMAWNGSGVRASISLPSDGTATFEIFDASGRRAFSRRLESLKAGEQAVEFATRLAPGMYFGRLTHEARSAWARLVVVN